MIRSIFVLLFSVFLATQSHAAVINLVPVDLVKVSDNTTPAAINGISPNTDPIEIRGRTNLNNNGIQIATFLQFDLSSLSPADVNNAAYSASFSIDFNQRVNISRNLRALLGRNISGSWSSTPGTLPLHDWGLDDETNTIIAADQITLVNNVRFDSFGTYTVDVSSIVRDWVNGVNSNDGFVVFYNTNENQGAGFANPTLQVIPEPSTYAMFALLLPAAFFYVRRQRRAKS